MIKLSSDRQARYAQDMIYDEPGAYRSYNKESVDTGSFRIWNSDISLDSIVPQTDNDDLKITVSFLDKNEKVLTSIGKTLGNVKEGIQVNFSII